MIPCINLLPWRTKLQQTRLQRFLILLALIIFATVSIFFIIHLSIRRELSTLYLSNLAITEQSKKLELTIHQVNLILAQKQNWVTQVNIIKTLQKQRLLALFIMNTLADTMTSNAYIDNLRYENSNMVLSGYAKDTATITLIVNHLKTYPVFSKIVLTEMTINQNETLTHHFNMTVQIKTKNIASQRTPTSHL